MPARRISWAYLVYVGLRMILSGSELSDVSRAGADSSAVVYRQGVLTNVLNPKAAIAFMAFLPQFITPDGSAGLQLLILGLTTCVVSVLVFCGISLAGELVRRLVLDRRRVRLGLEKGLGAMLMAVGARLALAQK